MDLLKLVLDYAPNGYTVRETTIKNVIDTPKMYLAKGERIRKPLLKVTLHGFIYCHPEDRMKAIDALVAFEGEKVKRQFEMAELRKKHLATPLYFIEGENK